VGPADVARCIQPAASLPAALPVARVPASDSAPAAPEAVLALASDLALLVLCRHPAKNSARSGLRVKMPAVAASSTPRPRKAR